MKLLLSFRFHKNENLIYIISEYLDRERLYIFEFLKKRIVQLAYNENFYIIFTLFILESHFRFILRNYLSAFEFI